MADQTKLGILVGGGPAPGINSVIGAATIGSLLHGVEVWGLQDGFEHVMRGDSTHARRLTIDEVSRIHFRGGSILGTSRANPTGDVKTLATTVATLANLGITRLVTIGGDDTAYAAIRISAQGKGALRVVHVPKTIDNDLDLPPAIDTFGFQTARHVGAELVRNIMVDAATTTRWYFLVAMGRKVGHLALGIGKAAGATLTLIPEEFGKGEVPLGLVVDTLAGAVIKRRSEKRRHGVAVIGEGVALRIRAADLGGIEGVERDEHGNVRIAEIDIGMILKNAVRDRLQALGIKATIVSKDIGYELRCADPIPFDMEYTRDLGYCASRYVLEHGGDVMVTIQGDRFVPIPFAKLVDPETGRARIRLVDVTAASYGIARRYMIRLRRDDFTDQARCANLAQAAGLSEKQFREQFEYVTADEPERVRLAD
jgi:6-phosphofructokinase 1